MRPEASRPQTMRPEALRPEPHAACCRLGEVPPRFRGRISAISTEGITAGLPGDELERRLLEMGFVEGAEVELRYQGLIGADPIAVRVNGVLVALRRREARAVLVERDDAGQGRP